MRKQAHFIVSGRVQGVGFRFFVRECAQELKLNGAVRNLPDGTVEAWAEGEENTINSLLELIRQGNGYSRVTDMDLEWSDAAGEWRDFRVVR